MSRNRPATAPRDSGRHSGPFRPPLPLPMRAGDGEPCRPRRRWRPDDWGRRRPRGRAHPGASATVREVIKPDGPPPPFTSAPIPAAEVTSFPERANGRLVGHFERIGYLVLSGDGGRHAEQQRHPHRGRLRLRARARVANDLRFVAAYAEGLARRGLGRGRRGHQPAVVQVGEPQLRLRGRATRRLTRPDRQRRRRIGLAWGQPRKQRFRRSATRTTSAGPS